eukprot:GEZU01041234.1.p1 GENE.GEZU01041234.1~~GEZU01041234.1.p1  ORF type:complete len:137 (-),score=58.55 GEZU01041234.1:39-449(-)
MSNDKDQKKDKKDKYESDDKKKHLSKLTQTRATDQMCRAACSNYYKMASRTVLHDVLQNSPERQAVGKLLDSFSNLCFPRCMDSWNGLTAFCIAESNNLNEADSCLTATTDKKKMKKLLKGYKKFLEKQEKQGEDK